MTWELDNTYSLQDQSDSSMMMQSCCNNVLLFPVTSNYLAIKLIEQEEPISEAYFIYIVRHSYHLVDLELLGQ